MSGQYAETQTSSVEASLRCQDLQRETTPSGAKNYYLCSTCAILSRENTARYLRQSWNVAMRVRGRGFISNSTASLLWNLHPWFAPNSRLSLVSREPNASWFDWLLNKHGRIVKTRIFWLQRELSLSYPPLKKEWEEENVYFFNAFLLKKILMPKEGYKNHLSSLSILDKPCQ